MNSTQITILIVVLVLVTYLCGLAYVLSRLIAFRDVLRKQIIAITVVNSEKREVLLSLYREFHNAGVPLTEKDEETTTKVRWLNTESKTGAEAERASLLLNDMEKSLSFLGSANSWVKKGDEYDNLTETMQDLNLNYRRIVANYNSAVLGYMYYRKFPLYRFLFFLFGFKMQHPLP